MEKSEKVERYYSEEHQFKKAIGILRELAMKTNMEETFKWMFPTYTLDGKNIIAICKFKKHFGIWFFNGVFLSDPQGVLENAQEGKTKAMRHWKFYTLEDIDKTKVLGYINEAIENQKNGKVLAPIRRKAIKKSVPELLKEALADELKIANAFKKLSTSSQNEYIEYIETAKQEKTKLKRLEKILPMIAEGKGLNDKYR